MKIERGRSYREILSRFLPVLRSENASVIVHAWELRRTRMSATDLVRELGGRWVFEHDMRGDRYVFRRPGRAVRTVRTMKPSRDLPEEPEGRWMDRRSA